MGRLLNLLGFPSLRLHRGRILHLNQHNTQSGHNFHPSFFGSNIHLPGAQKRFRLLPMVVVQLFQPDHLALRLEGRQGQMK